MTPHWIAHAVHILRSIEEAKRTVARGQDYCHRYEVYQGLLRMLQTTFESAHKLPSDIKERHLDVRWHKVAELRNILVHDYLGDVYEDKVLAYIEEHFPPLQAAMLHHLPNWKELLAEEEKALASQHPNHDTDGNEQQ